ncbi:FAD-dependent oxidoreductase [Desulforhopalus singaporensis]|uniref:NADPH-dependent 2,4-dienoyl-CoA reductase, sulfur reductase n=1 Tax=Desulforhopalus singaporensis TaxID=91360 RepID=A0A1H0UJY5_9BACT|nr:FAD-dependent oxidoreductase [Desulforhopalus singaporensis]SDP66403.1 NADPH-dependent 2,4-dienoyl-CoA reductase, sulfur reductase [Desulforhopalus singaporensis]
MAEKIIIIGGVAAGPKAACRVKRLLPGAEVTIIDQDSLISYGGCGIPYYVSGDVADEKELRSTSFHMVRDEYFFEKAKGVHALTSTRALAIDRKNKTVDVEDLNTGKVSSLPYDTLMLATGSTPVQLPVPGADSSNVFTISDLHKAVAIKEMIAKGLVSRAVVIGGGAIGVEMAEALSDLWGVETSLIEYMDQLLPGIVDKPMARILEKNLRDNNIDLYLNEAAEQIITENGKGVAVRTAKSTLDTDLIIMAAGIRARSELARDAGLLVGATGGIVVNERMQTSDPDIYAAGDCVEIMHLVSGQKFIAPFGSMANKEGRVAADNMAKIPSTFKGGVGSFIVKAFDVSLGAVGLSLQAARAAGFDAELSLSSPSDRAHFYPGQDIMCIGLVFDRRTRKVLGLQGTGPVTDGLSARIDAAAVALCAGATLDDFSNIEMAYSPPFSPAIDPINAAAYIADNLCDNRMRQLSLEQFYAWMESPATNPERVVLDVRHPNQAEPFVEAFGADFWLSLPYDEVRDRFAELPRDKELVIFCNAGSRSFEVQVFLDHVGYGNNIVLPGGFNVIRRMGADWLPVD